MTKPVLDAVNRYRTMRGYRLHERLDETTSPFAQVSQQLLAFDYPRAALPAQFHYSGPFRSGSPRSWVDFPFDQLTTRRLVYASLGTRYANRNRRLLWLIAKACEDLPAQLVISLGDGSTPPDVGDLPGTPLVVNFAPQLELLQRSALCVTHAGLNTVLESLSFGVPILAIPVTNDQPGVASRVAWTGAGECIAWPRRTVKGLRLAIERVLGKEPYRTSARRLQNGIQASAGIAGAGDVVEEVIKTGAPVLRDA